jgi:predicted TIM-barrel fold metal-dependent hydrolase
MAASELADRCRLGALLEGEVVVDAHAHLGPWYNFHIPESDAAGMVRTMDAVGVDACISSPHVAIGPDYRKGNRQAMAAADKFPGRIIPYITINPNYPEAEIREEIAHWHERGGIRAFKIHPSCHKYKVDGPGYRPMFEYAQEHSLPVLSHSWAGDSHGGPSLLSRLAEKMPTVKFLVGHAASSWGMVDEACEEAIKCDNVFLDLTGSQLLYMALETMVSRAGVEKVLFGSDIPFIDPRPALGRILMSRLSDDEKRQVLGLNARAIFGL